jgi:Cu2+-exporting ATPase
LHQLGFNLLVSISVTVAFAFSALAYGFEVAGKAFADEPFFETIALLIALIYLGRTIQAATRRASGSALHEVESMQPRSALLLAPEGSGTTGIDVRLLHLGDLVRILPQSLVPSDGVVVKGRSEVDEAAMTGESVPSHKRPGSAVMAGTRNLGGTLDVAIGALAHVNSLARMATLVETAQASRPPMQDWVDTLSAFILPVAVACSGLALLVWSLVGVYVRRSGGGEAVVNAITYAIAILIVSCPCALGLAVRLVV